MSIYKDIYVSKKEPLVVEIAEGTNGIDIELHVADWTIPTSATAQIYLEKPSGALIYNAASIEDNSIIISPTTQMTAEVGVNKGQLRIVNGTDILHTFIFYVKVYESIIDDSAIESQDEFTALEEALAAVSDLVTHTELQGKGSTTKGVYFDASGVAQAMTYSVNSDVPEKPVIEDTVTVTSLPMTVAKAGMTARHKAVYAYLETSSAQTADWNITPADGSYTIFGSISGSTTLNLIFLYIPA